MTDDEITGYLEDNGYPPHIVRAGRAGLVKRWQEFVCGKFGIKPESLSFALRENEEPEG